MRREKHLFRVLLVIFILASPALAARILSEFFDVQYLQPLAITKESVEAYEEATEGDGFVIVDVSVAWGRDWTGTLTQAQLRETISKTLAHQTELYRFSFEDVEGEDIGVTFTVGPNSYGPFPPGQTARGIKSALLALKMTNEPEG